MSRPSLKTSLISLFTFIGVLIAVLGWQSLSALVDVDAATDRIADGAVPNIIAVDGLKAELLTIRIAYLNHITSTAPEQITKADSLIAEELAKIDTAIATLRPFANTPEQAQILSNLSDQVHAYEKQGEELQALSRQNKNQEALAVLDKMRAQMQPIMEKVNRLAEMTLAEAGAEVTASKQVFDSAFQRTIILSSVLGLILIGATLYAWGGIARPIERITVAMRRLAGGDSDSAIPFAGRADELGQMASAVEVFRAAAIDNKRLSVEAEHNRQKAEEDRVSLQRQAEAEARQKLLEATSALAIGMQRLAQGDLSCQITDPVSEDFIALRDDFNTSVRQLSQTLSSVSESTRNIESGSREIASGASDLSKRTEQQAAALEETAAALDQITVNVSTSSKRTEEARSVALLANRDAAKSAEVVANAVEAMRRIEESSQQISNIIGVIDEIAFQTNLLALNAGVEAARAGEAGKGFAVVAQEVRELAQRSAQAAKEIKGLIQKSSTEVEGGVRLVSDTGTALHAIGDYVVQINKLMDAIATSAREQATGLAEVNSAVNQMDQTTQQNAAMVEESTAASAALAQETGNLRGLIGQFRLLQPEGNARGYARDRAA